ncbi:MAG: putative baseplate assembly protein, partial [bacterium]
RAFSRPGIVRFLVPVDAAPTDRYGRAACWICARWVEGTYHHQPRLGLIHHNAVWARAATRVVDELIGAGTGAPGQTARTRRAPVLGGERLEVRETRDGPWVRWQAVPDFNGSGPGDRHYQLDFATGEITFGDGRRGLPPPLGKDNIRLTYETGGGSASNRAAGAITQMTHAVPYVTAVTNPVAASGGRDALEPDIAGGAVPRSMRHRGRAVAAADYADLAREASDTLARVAVIEPDFRRENPVDFDPDTETTGRGGWVQGVVGSEDASGAKHVGLVEVVIVPAGAEARPTPTQALIDTVYHALASRAAPGAQVRVTGPRWVTLTVAAELGATAAEAARVVRDATAALDAYLHPLTGGPTSEGWPFGRRPRDSDIQAVLAEVAGVRFVRKLTVDSLPLLPLPEFVGVDRDVVFDELTPRQAAAALVATGDHALTVVEAR